MKKNSIIPVLLAIYGYMLLIDIALYALIRFYELDITLLTNLLIWSATLFAPVVVLFLLDEWKHQELSKKIEECADDTWIQFSLYMSAVNELCYFSIHKYIDSVKNSKELNSEEFTSKDYEDFDLKFNRAIVLEKEFYNSFNRFLLRVDIKAEELSDIRKELFRLSNIMDSSKHLKNYEEKRVKDYIIKNENLFAYHNFFELEKKFKLFIKRFVRYEGNLDN